MKKLQILALILLLAGNGMHASDEKPAKLHEMYHDNWYGTYSRQRCPNPLDDLMFEHGEIQSRFSCQEWIHHRNGCGNTLSIQAIQENNIRRVERLIELGVDVNQKNDFEMTCLHMVVWFNRGKAIPLLVAAGANVNLQNNHGDTPLHYAVMYNAHKFIKLLLDAGADTKIRNNDGKTVRELIISPEGRVIFDQEVITDINQINNFCSLS